MPCPLCGGLVHPIAGKCKHCKADLTSYHSARPAASQPLPSLQAPAHNGHASNGQPHGHAGHAGYAPLGARVSAVAAAGSVGAAGVGPVGPVGMMVAAAREAAQPVLPPRPPPVYPQPRSSSWRSWPILVIIVAVLAILAALVVMVLPELRGAPGDGKHSTLQPPPAPERMQTEPELKQPAVRPPVVQPRPSPPAQDPPAPSPSKPSTRATDPDDEPDGSAPDRSGASLTPRSDSITEAMIVHVCKKLDECGNVDPTSRATCDGVAGSQAAPPIRCGAAFRCLARIDALPCGTPSDLRAQLEELFHRVPDCAVAARC